MERRTWEAPKLIPLDINTAQRLLAQAMSGLLKTRMIELQERPIQSGGKFNLKETTQRLLAPHLRPGETLNDYILRTQQRPAVLGDRLGFSRARKQTVYSWYRRLGIDYRDWPQTKVRGPQDIGKRRERVMGKLRKVFGVDPLDEIGRLMTFKNMSIGRIEKTKGFNYGSIRKWLEVLGLDGRKIVYEYLLKNKIFESELLSNREKLVLQKYYQEGMSLREIVPQMRREDGKDGHIERERVNQLKGRALRKAKAIINPKRQPLKATVNPDIPDRPTINHDILKELSALDIRTYNILRRARIVTIKTLTEMTEQDVLQIKNVGPGLLKVIKVFLASKGISLRQ